MADVVVVVVVEVELLLPEPSVVCFLLSDSVQGEHTGREGQRTRRGVSEISGAGRGGRQCDREREREKRLWQQVMGKLMKRKRERERSRTTEWQKEK